MAALCVALAVPSAAAAEPRVLAGAGIAADPARDAAWQQFFAALPHGPELDSLTVVLSPPADVARRCGRRADGCYSGLLRQIVLPGLGGPGVSYLADVAAHEYGHHLAAQSDNAPFDDWLGTKRWFTRERICVRMRRGELADGPSAPYERSPAEGFAEAYRVAAGGGRHDWIVDAALFPDPAARRAILADARSPWAGGRERRFSGRLSRRRPARTFMLRVPLDGRVNAAVTGSGSLIPALTLSDGGRVLARGPSLSFVDCGRRVLRLTVRARGGSGRFRVMAVVP
jgi:hypothetical protein